jgi:16S rRNA (guanine527-N7)-methyltransferase
MFHVKHSDQVVARRNAFGDRLPLAERYADWLTGAGIDRGLLGPREADRIWERHVINCAALQPLLPATGVVCDVGSGAGLPGLVLAIQCPNLQFVLLEPLLRRATFLTEVAADLGLDNVTVVRDRAEDHRPPTGGYRAVVARAVAPLVKLIPWTLPLVAPEAPLLAMKGEGASAEVAAAQSQLGEKWTSQIAEWQVVSVGESDNVSTVVRIVRGP